MEIPIYTQARIDIEEGIPPKILRKFTPWWLLLMLSNWRPGWCWTAMSLWKSCGSSDMNWIQDSCENEARELGACYCYKFDFRKHDDLPGVG